MNVNAESVVDPVVNVGIGITDSHGPAVTVHEKVDPSVLGGLRVRVGDYVLDGTLRRRLDRLRHGIVNPR